MAPWLGVRSPPSNLYHGTVQFVCPRHSDRRRCGSCCVCCCSRTEPRIFAQEQVGQIQRIGATGVIAIVTPCHELQQMQHRDIAMIFSIGRLLQSTASHLIQFHDLSNVKGKGTGLVVPAEMDKNMQRASVPDKGIVKDARVLWRFWKESSDAEPLF